MKYRVIRFFIDRDSLKDYNAGDLFPCDDPERAKELINKCYIEKVQEKAPETEQAPAKASKPKKDTALAKEPKKTAKSTVKKTATKKKA